MGYQNTTSLVSTPADPPKGQTAIAVGTLATPARAFMITTDGQFNYTTLDGTVVTDASGTWSTKVQYSQWIKSIDAGTTAVGKLFL